ncbi:flavodoxin family protein [Hyunsoonleella rubra]|uniref:Flavodoxin family protein n=1 Tax=Hyunsoonleella rubra TaxID=1737062 RepID=A0ABW5TC77_9FLAO
MKRILVIHYSQTGQLTEIVKNIASPLEKDDAVQVDYQNIKMVNPYPFPWTKEEFFGIFPETFKQIPAEVNKVSEEILSKNYDLIILGYQVWYLTPSQPIVSFLKTPEAKTLLSKTPVITVIGCRNMWVMAQEKMKRILKDLGANLVGNIALVDRHLNHISVITISKWMFSGEKKRFLGIFPKPGVAQKDIDGATKFGHTILSHLKNSSFDTLQQSLVSNGAVVIKPFLVTTDKRANLIFGKWANLLISKGDKNNPKRQFWVKVFNKYLLFAIWFIAPIVFILFLLTYLPNYKKIVKEKAYYKSLEIK